MSCTHVALGYTEADFRKNTHGTHVRFNIFGRGIAMMLCLMDEPTIEIFDSPDHPPDWIEAIDIENDEYQFCSDDGQQYVGVITQPGSWFRLPHYELKPVGRPHVLNAIALVDRAVAIEPNHKFNDLAALRTYLLNLQRRVEETYLDDVP